MAQDKIDDEIKVLLPDLVHHLGHEFFKLLASLDTHDKAVIAAYESGDVDAARREIETAIQGLGESIYWNYITSLSGKDRHRAGFFMFDVIEDAVRFSRRGHRHWLTRHPGDNLTISPDDITRRIWIEARSALILDLFGNCRGMQNVADEIAERLSRAGFRTNRLVTTHGHPTGGTIYEWLKQIRAMQAMKKKADQAEDSKPKLSRAHKARYDAFHSDRKDTAKLGYEKALDLLEHDCRFFVRRLIGACPPEKMR